MSLHKYATVGDEAGVRAELAKGVPVDCVDGQGRTPLACAAGEPSAGVEILRLLIEAGADVNRPVEEEKRFPVGLAACSASFEKVRLLLDAGADIDFESPSGYTILINTVYALQNDEQLVPMIDFLVAEGAAMDCETEYGESPLSVASLFGRFDAVKSLLDAGADPTPLRWTELMQAVAWGTSADVERMLAKEDGLHDRDRWERTPWLLSVVAGDIDKAQVLRAAGAGVNDQARGGDTALMISAGQGRSEMLRWLLEAGVEIDARDGAGQTALMLAAQAGHADCVELLLQAGANPSHRNDYDENAIQLASGERVVRLLVATGEKISELGTEMKRTLVGLSSGGELGVSKAEYQSGCRPRFGRSNPEVMSVPFWQEMVRAGISAYEAKVQFDDATNMTAATWCFDRFGMSFTELPDGRFVQIGGEHEDFYDPDFCIYNDVVIHERTGEFKILGYPREVFPPTDFHSATFVDGFIYIVGGLGYHGSRRFGTTPIYRLNCSKWRIEAIKASGDNPGWIYEHKATLAEPGVISVEAGKICTEVSGDEQHLDNRQEFLFEISSRRWTRRDASV